MEGGGGGVRLPQPFPPPLPQMTGLGPYYNRRLPTQYLNKTVYSQSSKRTKKIFYCDMNLLWL